MFIRILFTTLVLSTLLFSQGRIIPEFPRPLPEPLSPIPVKLENVSADISINGDIARVKLEQSFKNESKRRLQGEYIYSLPGIAQISDFYLYINGQKTKGELLDSKSARQYYEDIVRRSLDPALLEYSDYNLFKARIFPIDPGQSRKIEINYDQVLSYESGLYRFELPIRQSGQGLIDNYKLNIDLKTKDKIANVYSPSHDISTDRKSDNHVVISIERSQMNASKDFILYFSKSDQQIAGSLLGFRPRTDRDGFFMLFLNPAFGKTKIAPLPKDIIFVIDVSGSMGGEKIEQAKKALAFCVNGLNQNDRFEIITFSSTIRNFSGKFKPVNSETKQNAQYFIDNLSASGGTNINAALEKALNLKTDSDSRLTSVIFLTDGLPTEGVQDIKNIVGNVSAANNLNMRLFNFGVGYDVNTYLLDKLAEESNGSTDYVKPGEDIERSISALFSRISDPVLTELELAADGVELYDIYPQRLPDLFKNQRLMVTGRYRKSASADIKLSGFENKTRKTFQYKFDFPQRNQENDFVAKLWANRKVNFLLNKIRFEGENPELVESVKQLALEYGIVTPYTSYLVKEQDEEIAAMEDNLMMAPNSQIQQISKSTEMKKQRSQLEYFSSDLAGAGTSSGKAAVMASSVRQEMADDEVAKDQLITRKFISGRTFILNDGIWKQNGLENADADSVEIKFGSKDYFELAAKDKEIKTILSLGKRVWFLWNGKRYKISD